MQSITINGVTYTAGKNINISNGDITIDGDRVIIEDTQDIIINITNCNDLEIKSDKSIQVNGTINGNIEAMGSVNCDDVEGNIQANGSVNCDKVKGNVTANGSVRCKKIEGRIL
jgi:cytoskeletal protein CcmA (bactofilin family)